MGELQIERCVRVINGDGRDIVRLVWDGRVVEAMHLDMADQWDFMEIAGGQIDNEAWVGTALLACSVISIDGVPLPSGVKSRDEIRRILRKLGEVGLDALQEAFEGDAAAPAKTASDIAAAAGN